MRAVTTALLLACLLAISTRAQAEESQIESPLVVQAVAEPDEVNVDDDGIAQDVNADNGDDDDDGDDNVDDDEADEAADNQLDNDDDGDDDADDDAGDNEFNEDTVDDVNDEDEAPEDVDRAVCNPHPCPRQYIPICVQVNDRFRTIPSECEFRNKLECANSMRRLGRAAPVYKFLFDGECEGPFDE